VLGRDYKETVSTRGSTVIERSGDAAQTARHIATKLARHFVADDPPQAAIDTLAATFMKTDGDLREVSLALIDLPQIWSEPLTKIKTPNDLVISAYRTFGITDPKFGDG